MMGKTTLSLVVATITMMIMSTPLLAQSVYRLDVVAQNGVSLGRGTPVALGTGPSINDAGKVAFVARDTDASHGRVMLLKDTTVEEDCFIGALASVSGAVQVNENAQIVFRLNSDDGLFSDVVRIDDDCSGPILGRGSLSASFPQPFDVVLAFATLNDNGRGVFSADKGVNTMLGSRASGSGAYNISPVLTGYPNLYPMIADNDTAVVRWGASATSPLLRFVDTTSTFSAANFIAEDVDFNAIGEQPGTSDDGHVVAFVGDHKTQGFGIYISLFNGSDFTPIKILGVPGNGMVNPVRAYLDVNKNGQYDNGENDLGRFASYSLQPRVGVNRTQSDSVKVYTVAFIAFDSAGQYGLYTLRVDISNVGLVKVSEPVPVVKIGGSIFGIDGTISNIRIYDPLNNSGQLAFWVATSSGGQAIVRATPAGRVTWQSGQPVNGAEIEAYYLVGNNPATAEIVPIPPTIAGQPVKSDVNGIYSFPEEFYNYPIQPNETVGRRGIRAKVQYTEITGDTNEYQVIQTIVNYPDWDPLRPFKTPTTEGQDVVFPNPVFFNAGVIAQVNNNSADRQLRAFLTTDSGSTESELTAVSVKEGIALNDLRKWVEIKKGLGNARPIPAFVYFAMPTKKSCLGVASDNVSWGYDNCVPQSEDRINGSVTAILEHFSSRIKPQIVSFNPNDAEDIPFHFLAHSMGGVILRAVINDPSRQYPQLAKYVTFDTPHGGVAYASNSLVGFIDDFWSEALMNGTSSIINQPPPNRSDFGWNKRNRLTSTSFADNHLKLYFSSLNNLKPLSLVVTPDPSAFGVGRIMRPASLVNPLSWFSEQPNGYCERFLHGWTMEVTNEDHSIQGAPQVLVSAARFLAGDDVPQMGTRDYPDVDLTSAVLAEGPGGVCTAVTEPFRAIKRYTIRVSDEGTQQRNLNISAGQAITVKALLSGVGAQLKLVDGNNVPLVFNPTSTQFADNVFVLEAALTVPVSGAKWELTSGAPSEDALSIIEVTISNSSQRGSAGAVNLHNSVGNSVPVNIKIVNSSGVVATGVGGSGAIAVTKPDGSEVSLPVFDDGVHNDAGAGDGIYGAAFTETQSPGRYFFRGDLDVDLGSGNLLSRSAEGMFYVDSDAMITNLTTAERLLDDDADGKWDAVAVDFSFNISRTGPFRLSSQLFDGVELVSYLESNFSVTDTQVVQRVTLRIPAEIVLKSLNGGPFTLKEIDVADVVQALFVRNFADYQTGTYSKTSFDVPSKPVVFNSLPSFGPSSGGTTVSLLGQNLTNVSAVFFGTQPAASFTIADANTIFATVPAWDGSNRDVGVKLVTPWQETFYSSIFIYQDFGSQPPVLASIGNRSVNEGQALVFTVSASDPDSTTLNYSVNSLPAGATFTNQTFSWTPTDTQSGSYPVTFTVSDGTLNDSESITITVVNNDPPAISPIADRFAGLGEALNIQVTTADPENDTVVLSATVGANADPVISVGAVFTDNGNGTGLLTWTPIGQPVGQSYNFVFTARDSKGALDTEDVLVTITPPVVLVTWVDVVGVTVSGNTITKTAATSWGTGGAASSQTMSADGGVDFLATQTNTSRMCGLSNTNLNANYTSIAYAIYLHYSKAVYIYENGTNRGQFGTYVVGDRFQVERAGSTISYKKNGIVFYTSTVASTGSLLVDTAIYHVNGVVADAKMSGITVGVPSAINNLSASPADASVTLAWSAPSNNGAAISQYIVQYGTVASGGFASTVNDDATPGATITGLTNGTAYQFRVIARNSYGNSPVSNVVSETPKLITNVTWGDLVGVSVNGNTITKTAATAWGTGGAASAQTMSADGGVDFLATQTNTSRMCGLSNTNSNANYTSIAYAIYLHYSKAVYIYENGTSRGQFGTYVVGDRFQVERTGSTVRYKKNGVVFYTSTIASTGSLLVDAAIYHVNGVVADAKMSGITVGVPSAINNLSASAGDANVSLIWSAPSNNGAAISQYIVQYGTVASGGFASTLNDDATPGVTVSGLTNGTAYQFRVIARNSYGNSPVSNVVSATPKLVTNVAWVDLVGVSVNGNTITKTAATSWGNGGAASSLTIGADGGVDFLATQTNTSRMCGLSNTNPDANYTNIAYALYLHNTAAVYIYENGTNRGQFGTYKAGDRFQVERLGTTIYYKKNGVVFYTSTVASSGSLLVDAVIYHNAGVIADAKIYL